MHCYKKQEENYKQNNLKSMNLQSNNSFVVVIFVTIEFFCYIPCYRMESVSTSTTTTKISPIASKQRQKRQKESKPTTEIGTNSARVLH
jgi:hypothetical protein